MKIKSKKTVFFYEESCDLHDEDQFEQSLQEATRLRTRNEPLADEITQQIMLNPGGGPSQNPMQS